jgi:flagellar hook-associated protein 3 FlgL
MSRVSFDNSFRLAVNSLGQSGARLQTSQEQLASSKRVNRSSDDPVAAPKILQLATSLVRMNEFDKNLDFAEGRLAQVSDHLSRIADLLSNLKEAAVQGANGTYSAADRASLKAQAGSVLDQIDSFVAALGEGKLGLNRTADVADGTKFPVSLTTTDLNALTTLKTDLRALIYPANPADPTSNDLSTAAGWNRLLGKVDGELALTSDTGALVMATRYGSFYQQVENVRDTRSSLRLEFERIMSNLRDADIAEVSINISRDQTVLEALQKSYSKLQGMSLFNFL